MSARLHSLSEVPAIESGGTTNGAYKAASKEASLTAAIVRDLFDYDARSGELRWRRVLGKRVLIGSRAGSRKPNGYWQIGLYGKVHNLSRVIWLHVYGEWPNGEVDHRDTNPSNHRIENLRVATRKQNEFNKPGRNSTGFKGVSFDGRTGRFKASIRLNGRSTHLGCFASAALAGAAYAKAAAAQHGEFARS